MGAVNSLAKPFLLALKVMDKVNGDTVSQFLTEYFYQNGFKTDQFRVFVTDGAAYCLKAGRTLKCIFHISPIASCDLCITRYAFINGRRAQTQQKGG